MVIKVERAASFAIGVLKFEGESLICVLDWKSQRIQILFYLLEGKIYIFRNAAKTVRSGAIRDQSSLSVEYKPSRNLERDIVVVIVKRFL